MFGPEAAKPCPMCASFLDGFIGNIIHLDPHIAFVVVAASGPARLHDLRDRMGWQALSLFSAEGSGYQADYLAEAEDGSQLPMLNIFTRRSGEVRHFWGSELFHEPSPWHSRHIDALWPLWKMLDLTPDGRGEGVPALRKTGR
jgi:predicted dithiol-disulfide oxidoreductase (DUF899 family)